MKDKKPTFEECRKFVSDWMWNAEVFGDKRTVDSFDRNDTGDAAQMIQTFCEIKFGDKKYPTESEILSSLTDKTK